MKNLIQKSPHSYDFFKIIQIIGIDNVRFKVVPFFDVKTSAIKKIEYVGDKTIIYVNVFAMGGVFGPLPSSYTELWLDQNQKTTSDQKKDTSVQDFFDIFQNRIIHARYNVEKKYNVTLQEPQINKSILYKTISSLILKSNKSDDHVNHFFVNHIDFFLNKKRSIDGLSRIVNKYFNMTIIKTIPFNGGWNTCDDSEQSYLSSFKKNFNVLGKNIILGKRTWNQSKGILIDIGRINWVSFYELFLKSQKIKENLKKIIINYLGHSVNVSLVGFFSDTKALQISSKESHNNKLGVANKLGVSTFLNKDEKELTAKFRNKFNIKIL